MQQEPSRWQTAMAIGAQGALAVRWHTVTKNLLIARAEYVSLLEAEPLEISQVRKAAQRMYDLQEQCGVLTRELQGQR